MNLLSNVFGFFFYPYMLKTTVIYIYPIHCIQLIIDHFSFSYMVGIMVTVLVKLDIVGPNVNVVQVRNVLQKI